MLNDSYGTCLEFVYGQSVCISFYLWSCFHIYCSSMHWPVRSSHILLCVFQFSHAGSTVVRFFLCHCHWHVEILASASTVLLGSQRVATITPWTYLVVFHHLCSLSHLLQFAVMGKCGDHPGSCIICTFPCSFCSLVMWVLIPALECIASGNCQCPFHAG